MTKNRALEILETIGIEFPGLLDGETEVNGTDLVDYMTQVMCEVFPCEHNDTDDGYCLDCDADLTETFASQAYDRAKDARKYGE